MKISFVHIPRTSGTTVEHLARQNGVNLEVGHWPFGCFNGDSLFTFLRDPVKRWVSVFNHSYKRKGYVLWEWYREYKSVQKVLRKCLKTGVGCNQMVRQLGCPDFYEVCRPQLMSGFADRDMFRTARRRLRKRFDFVGVVECGGHERLCKYYGWRYQKRQRHESTTQSLIDLNDRDTMVMLNEINKYDIKLYEKCAH